MTKQKCQTEYDFALAITGVPDLVPEVEDALFNAGCNDATFGIQNGCLYAEFARTSQSLQDAILSAIRDIKKAGIGAKIVYVDECNLVTQAEIARRINRTRQLIHQYITGERGPGNFPPPVCHLKDDEYPLWQWCAVSFWLAENNIIRREESWNAEVVAAINNALERARQQERYPDLVKEISQQVGT